MKSRLRFSLLLLLGSLSFAQTLPDLTFPVTRGQLPSLTPVPGSTVSLDWIVANQSSQAAASANISVFLSKSDNDASIPTNRRPRRNQSGQTIRRRGIIPGASLSNYLGGVLVHQAATGNLAGNATRSFQAQITIPRGVEPGNWKLLVVVDSQGALSEADETNNIYAVPVTIGAGSSNAFTLDFEGIGERLIPSDFYASLGVSISQIAALIAADLGGTGSFCSVHNGSPQVGFAPLAGSPSSARVLVNVPNGFSDVSMTYAQSTETQGGFRVWSGENGTGSIVATFNFSPHPNNGQSGPCYYDVWYPSGVIQASGKSLEFFENDTDSAQSWFLFDNITLTPNQNDIVVHNGPVTPFEGENAGHTFGVSLSQPIPSGKTVTIRLERVSPNGSGESMAVRGTSSVSFTSSNWNIQKPLSIWAPENNTDIVNQVRQFRLFRSSGTSPQVVPDQLLNVTEMDDDFQLSVSVAAGSNHGSVSPVLSNEFFDFNNDNWAGLFFTATPNTGYVFSEWTAAFSGENNDLLFQLSGGTQNPAQISQLVLDSGGGSSIGIAASFEPIGTVTVTMSHGPGGNTRVNGQILGNNQSTQIEPNQNVPLLATPFNGWAFAGWSSNPVGVIANPGAPSTSINTGVNTVVTANFIPTPVTLTMIHAGEGSTTVNGQSLGTNQTIQVGQGQNVPITAIPDPEWEFTGWTTVPSGLVANPASASTTINASADATLTATFNFVGTSFTLSSSGNGTTNPTGTQFVDAGDGVFVTVIPDAGYKFKDWTVKSGSPEIAPVSNDPNRFYVIVNDDSALIANFEEQEPGSLLIVATNLQNPTEIIQLREPDQVFQELLFSKQQGGLPNTFKLEFFNEGDLPLIIETVTMADRAGQLPSLIDSGFCLMQTQNFDPLDCQTEQPLSLDPLPPVGEPNPPTLYLDFGREPGFPDIPNPDPDFYVGTFGYLVPPINTQLVKVFDFRGIVEGSTDVSNVTLKKIAPDPMENIANGGSISLNPIGGGAMTEILFEMSNQDPNNPFFVDKEVFNSNTGTGIDPTEFGFFFDSNSSITVPKDGMVVIEMELKTKPLGANDPLVTYTALVSLGTEGNFYTFEISAVADGTTVTVVAITDFGDGASGFEEVVDGETRSLFPEAPEEGSIYKFLVGNPNPQQSLDISNIRFEALPDRQDDLQRFSIEQDQGALPGVVEPGQSKPFSIRLQGPFSQNFYSVKVLFDYRGTTGNTKSFSFIVEGRIQRANVRVRASMDDPLPNFDAIAFAPSDVGEVVSQALEIQHNGQPGSAALVGSINPDIGAGFSLDSSSFSIQPGGSHAFTVSFAGQTPGEFEGRVAISSNDPVVEIFVLDLSGTVLEPGAPPSLVPNFVGRINGDNISGLTVYDSAPLVEFTWDDAQSPLGIDRYQIILQPHGGPWLYGPHIFAPANTATIQTEDLVFGTSYSIHIRAMDTAGIWGNFANGGSFTVEQPGPPSTVPNFVGRINGQNISGLEIDTTSPTLDFFWSDATSPLGIGSYQIVLQPLGGPWLYSQIVPFPAQTHSTVADNLVPGQSYSIHIRARDTAGVWGSFVNGGVFSVAPIPPPSQVPQFVGRIGGQLIDGLAVYHTDPVIDFTWNHATSGQGIQLYHIVVKATDNNDWLYSQNISFPGTTKTISTSNLVVGKSYSTHIRAKDTLGVWGPFTNGGIFSVEPPPPPSSVPGFVGRINGQNIDGLTVHTTNPLVDFTWNNATSPIGIDLYNIVLQSTSGGPWLYYPNVSASANNHAIQTSNLEFGLAYSIHIRARDTAGTWGPFVNGGAFMVEAPAAPSLVPNFVGRINGQNISGLEVNTTNPAVNFSWNHATASLPIDRYQIVLQPTDGSGWLYLPVLNYPATSHTIQTSNLVYGKSYSIHIRARDNSGVWGPFGNGGAFNVVAPVPGPVPNFFGYINGQNINGMVISVTNPNIHFTWGSVIDPTGIDRFQIVVQPTDSGGWLYAPHVIAPATFLTLATSGLIPGKSYSIHIRARNGLGTWGPFVDGGVFTVQ